MHYRPQDVSIQGAPRLEISPWLPLDWLGNPIAEFPQTLQQKHVCRTESVPRAKVKSDFHRELVSDQTRLKHACPSPMGEECKDAIKEVITAAEVRWLVTLLVEKKLKAVHTNTVVQSHILF